MRHTDWISESHFSSKFEIIIIQTRSYVIMNLAKASGIYTIFPYKVTLPGIVYVSVLNTANTIFSLVAPLLDG